MNIIAVALTLLVAGASALPRVPSLHVENAIRSGQPRIITDSIASAIEDVSQAIIDAGLDPLIIEHERVDYALPVPTLFNIRAYLKDLLFKGASNIEINQLNFNLLTTRLTYNIRMPEILLNVRDSEMDVNFFGKNIHVRYSGKVALQNIVTTGNIRVNVGIISGVSIRDIHLTLNLGGIDSQCNLSLQHVDYSEAWNTALGHTIPSTLHAHGSEIDELLTIVGKQVIESML